MSRQQQQPAGVESRETGPKGEAAVLITWWSLFGTSVKRHSAAGR